MSSLRQKLNAFSIILRSIAITIRDSCLILYISFSRSSVSPRLRFDRRIHRWAKALLNVVNASVQIHNPYKTHLTENHPYILMSNHTSLYDIPLIFEVFPKNSIRMIAKKELFQVPLWGKAMKASEFLAIDRKNSTQAIKDLEMVREKMQDGIIPWIAPEGTRSRDGKLGVFKKGGFMLALQTGATIIPVTIKGAARILPAKTLNFKKHQTVDIIIGQAIDATQYTVATRLQLLKAVQQAIENDLQFTTETSV